MLKNTKLLVCLAALIAVYLAFFSDGHKAKKIQILLAVYPPGILPGTSNETMVFCLDQPYPLRSVKVVPSDEARTNKYVHPLWHVVAQAATQPIKSFRYGAALPGMQADAAAEQPEPLDADTTYSLQIEARNGLKGEITFQPPP
jgi:hypothetical protein